MKQVFFLLTLVHTSIVFGQLETQDMDFSWPNDERIAVSLSYDDALPSQLDHALPSLNRHGFKASFYVLPNSPVIRERLEEWRDLARQGHELGNHSIYHPCRSSLPHRDWVAGHKDLDKYTVEQMKEELYTANTFLYAIDGKTERTLTPPCGDRMAGGEDYIPLVSDEFIAIKALGEQPGFSVSWSPSRTTGRELIDYVRQLDGKTRMVNVIFHGVGGDYLSVDIQAHDELLQYLADNRDTYWVDSFINIMRYVNDRVSPALSTSQ